MTSHRARLARLERLASQRPAPIRDLPSRWPTLADLPTVRWDDPDAVEAFTADLDVVTRPDAAREAGDFAEAARLAPDAADAALRLYSVIPTSDESPEAWRARLERLPVSPGYVQSAASW